VEKKFTLVESEIPAQLDLLIHNQKARSLNKQHKALKLYNSKRIKWSIYRFDTNQIVFQDITDEVDDFGPTPQYITPRSSLDEFTTEEILKFLNHEDFNNISYTPQEGDLISFSSLYIYKSLKNMYRSEPRFNVIHVSYSTVWTLDSFLRKGSSKMIKQGILQ